jgi:hypothetical protein
MNADQTISVNLRGSAVWFFGQAIRLLQSKGSAWSGLVTVVHRYYYFSLGMFFFQIMESFSHAV